MPMDQDSLYGTLTRALLTICPEGFEAARIEAEVESDWTQKTYRYKTDGLWSQGQSVDAELDFDVDDALIALREVMVQDGRPAWSACMFTIRPAGAFSFDVTYPDEAAGS
ncbi:MAG: hypothetical protein AAF919_02710 [Pseudomonadota bacterium]